VPGDYRARLGTALDRAIAFAESVARDPQAESLARKAATALYNAVNAVLLAHESAQDERDARRLLISRMVLEHRLAADDPLGHGTAEWEGRAIDLLLADAPVPLREAQAAVAS